MIPSSFKLELLCQCEKTSWYYIVTKNSVVDNLRVQDPPVVRFFSVRNFTEKIKIYKFDIYKFKVKMKNTRTRCEICPKLTIKAPKQR